MIREVSVVQIKPGKEAEFELAFYAACDIIASVEGYVQGDLERSLDQPGRYHMIMLWETVDSHTVNFMNSPEAAQAMPLLLPLFADLPRADHLTPVPRPETSPQAAE